MAGASGSLSVLSVQILKIDYEFTLRYAQIRGCMAEFLLQSRDDDPVELKVLRHSKTCFGTGVLSEL